MRCVGTGKKKNHQLGSKEARKDVQILVKKGGFYRTSGGCSSLGWTVREGGVSKETHEGYVLSENINVSWM